MQSPKIEECKVKEVLEINWNLEKKLNIFYLTVKS
jgi:hypothetical protein